jgi:ArsR family transcriptional regulator
MVSPDQPSLVRGAELLKVLSSPVRLGVILELEEHGERCVHELVASLDVKQPLMSQHLRVLRSANLIVGRREGKEIRYSISDHHVIHIVHDAIRHAEEAHP